MLPGQVPEDDEERPPGNEQAKPAAEVEAVQRPADESPQPPGGAPVSIKTEEPPTQELLPLSAPTIADKTIPVLTRTESSSSAKTRRGSSRGRATRAANGTLRWGRSQSVGNHIATGRCCSVSCCASFKGALSVLFRRKGSMVPGGLPPAAFSCFIAIVFVILELYKGKGIPVWMLPVLDHPSSVQLFSMTLGYCIVMRCRTAIIRYYDSLSDLQYCMSKWGDAYAQLACFIRVSTNFHRAANSPDAEDKLRELYTVQRQLAHWFSMMHGLAIHSLQATQLNVPERIWLSRARVVDHAARESTRLDQGPRAAGNADVKTRGTRRGRSTRSAASHRRTSYGPDLGCTWDNGEQAANGREDTDGLTNLTVIGRMKPEEREAIAEADDAANLVHVWILECLTLSVSKGLIVIDPPIVSRVYQELSNGMLGYNQAKKTAQVQFPFPFAQMLVCQLCCFVFLAPMVIHTFTGGEVLSPLLTFLTVLGFFVIDQVSIVIEDPFGTDCNHLPLTTLHETFAEGVLQNSRTVFPKGCQRLMNW